jgi:hypothetical protein
VGTTENFKTGLGRDVFSRSTSPEEPPRHVADQRFQGYGHFFSFGFRVPLASIELAPVCADEGEHGNSRREKLLVSAVSRELRKETRGLLES